MVCMVWGTAWVRSGLCALASRGGLLGGMMDGVVSQGLCDQRRGRGVSGRPGSGMSLKVFKWCMWLGRDDGIGDWLGATVLVTGDSV